MSYKINQIKNRDKDKNVFSPQNFSVIKSFLKIAKNSLSFKSIFFEVFDDSKYDRIR